MIAHKWILTNVCANETLLKKKKIENRKRYTEKRKNENKICLTGKRKKYNIEHNCKSSWSKKSQNKSTYDSTQINSNKCLHKRDIAKKKKIENQKRYTEKRKNEHLFGKGTKKLYVYSMFNKQNLANTLKSYAMRNLQTKYKILQRVKIMQWKHIARAMNVNQKSSTLPQCLNVFKQKTSSGPIYVCTVCSRHGLEHLFMMLQI